MRSSGASLAGPIFAKPLGGPGFYRQLYLHRATVPTCQRGLEGGGCVSGICSSTRSLLSLLQVPLLSSFPLAVWHRGISLFIDDDDDDDDEPRLSHED